MHRQSTGMTGFDESLERVRSAIGLLDRKQIARVVSPTVVAAEYMDRKQAQGVDAEFDEVIKTRRAKSTGKCESPRILIRRIRAAITPAG